MILTLCLILIASGKELRESYEITDILNIGSTTEFTIPKSILYPLSTYEIRISYLGTVGGAFQMY